MNRAAHREKFVRFLETIARPGVPVQVLDDEESLMGSGLIDSLAVLSIISYLELEHGIDFGDRGVDPGQLSTVARVLDLIERETA